MQKPETNSLPKTVADARSIGHNLYFTGVACKNGHTVYRYVNDRACSACIKEKVKKAATTGGGNARRWAAKTTEQLAEIYARRKQYYHRTKDARLAEKRRSVAKLRETTEWKQRYKTNAKTFKQANPGKVNACTVKRRLAKMNRTPAWLTVDDHWMMEQAYEIAALRTKLFGFQWHVDHVIPLQGALVSGLHTPYNLQVIPASANISKANRYEVTA